jgi:hypothetical protein
MIKKSLLLFHFRSELDIPFYHLIPWQRSNLGPHQISAKNCSFYLIHFTLNSNYKFNNRDNYRLNYSLDYNHTR